MAKNFCIIKTGNKAGIPIGLMYRNSTCASGVYSMHMYGWFATGWAHDKDIPLVSKWAEHFSSAGGPNSWDGRPLVDIATVVMGILGG